MSLDVSYTYCLNLSEEEKEKIDQQVSKNQFHLKYFAVLASSVTGGLGLGSRVVYQKFTLTNETSSIAMERVSNKDKIDGTNQFLNITRGGADGSGSTVEAFSGPLPVHRPPKSRPSGYFNDGPGKPSGNGDGSSGDDNNMPELQPPKVESVKETEERVTSIYEQVSRMEEISDSESETESEFENEEEAQNPSDFKHGPNRFSSDSANYPKEKLSGSDVKFDEDRTQKNFDKHKDTVGMDDQDKNKANLEEFKRRTCELLDSPRTVQIKGSFRHERPVYLLQNDEIVVVIDADTFEHRTTVNMTELQLKKLQKTQNLGLDTRPDRPNL